MTTDQWVSQVYDDWGESSTNSIVSPAQITAWGNRAQRSLCIEGKILLHCAKSTLVDGQETYNIHPQCLKVECAFLTTLSTRPGQLLPDDVANRDPREQKGVPDRYYMWGSNVSGANQYTIGLQRIPDASVAFTDALETFFRKAPDTMVHSTQGTPVAPEVIEPWQDAMADFALMMIYRRLGLRSEYQEHRERWERWITKAQNYINPLQLDYPTVRRDTGYYTMEYPNP